MTALDVRHQKAFRDRDASLMRCRNKPSPVFCHVASTCNPGKVLFCAYKVNGGDSNELGTN